TREIGRKKRQAGRVGRTIGKRDLVAGFLRYLRSRGQVLDYRIVQCHFAAQRHVGEKQCRKYLCDGADFEDRVAVERTDVALINMSVGNDAPSLWRNDPDNCAGTLVLLIDVVRKEFLDLGV